MAAAEELRYRRRKRGEWEVWTDALVWREEWWPSVETSLSGRGEILRESRHARTSRMSLADGATVRAAFLKVYHRSGWRNDVKNLWRPSRAIRALRTSLLLERDGFVVPPVIAAGERRSGRLLRGAFLLTAAVDWPTLLQFGQRLACLPSRESMRRRRAVAAALGAEVGRFHQMGFVHGDLVAPNLLVDEGPPASFCFLDHDRSRKTWRPALRLQCQDLVELNRLAVPGVRHTDRFRFLLGYARVRGWSRDEMRSQGRWVALRTKARIEARERALAVE